MLTPVRTHTLRLISLTVVNLGILCSAILADDLPELIAQSAYREIDDEALESRRLRFLDSLAQLDAYLAGQAHGESWRSYLMLEQFQKSVQQKDGDVQDIQQRMNELGSVYYRLTGVHAGIEDSGLLRFRDSVAAYRRGLFVWQEQRTGEDALTMWQQDIEAFPDDEELKKEQPLTIRSEFLRFTGELTQILKEDNWIEQAHQTRRVNEICDWLQQREQLIGICQQIDQRYAKHNFDLHITSQALSEMTLRPVFEVEPVSEDQDGTQITGQAVVQGTAAMFPVLGNATGSAEVRFVGTVTTSLHGRQGPVSFDLTGDTALTAQKGVEFWPTAIASHYPVAQASTDLRTDRVCSKFRGPLGKLIRRIATNEISKERPEASRDLSTEASASFLERFEEDILDELSEAQRDLNVELNQSITKLAIERRRFDFLSDPSQLMVDMQFGSAVASHPPVIGHQKGEFDLCLNLHESTINAVCSSLFSGKSIRDFAQESARLGVELDAESREELPENFGLTLAIDQPIRVSFDKDLVRIRVSGASWQVEGLDLVGMNVGFTYQLFNLDGETFFQRLEEIDVTPPQGRASGRFIQQKNVLIRRLGEELPDIVQVESIEQSELPDMVDRLGNLSFSDLRIENGWLTAMLTGDRRTPSIDESEPH